MKHLSLLATLMLSSSMVCAGDWTYHNFNPDTKMYNPVPKYSCLEMICEGGCSENTETGKGICCPEPSIESCTSEQFDEYNCPLCKCQEGYEFWQGKCVEKCADKYGLTGKRDEYGNCLCTPGMEGCCPQNTYYSESSDTGCTCLPCPTFDTSGWEKYCSTECKFTPDDPDGCCKMVVVDGVENCLEISNSGGLGKAWLKLGHLDGKYKITYIAGGIKLGRFKDQQYRWYVPGFVFSKNGQAIQILPQTNKTYANIEELENNFNSKSVELVCPKDFNYGLYMHDGDIWSSVCGVGLGCTDNCGQIKYLFEKISECPANSSKTKTEQPIGTTGCYCKEGYFATQEGYCSTCPDGYIYDKEENGCFVEATLSVKNEVIPRIAGWDSNSYAHLYITFPKNITSGKWKIITSGEHSSQNHWYHYSYCYNNETFKLKEGQIIDLDNTSLSGFTTGYKPFPYECGPNVGASVSKSLTKNDNVLTVTCRAGTVDRHHGATAELYNSKIRLEKLN